MGSTTFVNPPAEAKLNAIKLPYSASRNASGLGCAHSSLERAP
ncbi:hypothetical protein PSNTI_09500 [Stutzerimonas stutzeri]|nr:hypothetical protein PSNTI_09500 [Stutzerimonas stutzeri]